MRRRVLAALLCLLPAALPAGPSAVHPYISDGDLFRVDLPSSWRRNEDITGRRLLRQFGVDAIGPGDDLSGYPRISVMYYAADHKQFRTMDKYVALNSRPAGYALLKGERFLPPGKAVAAGRPAVVLEAVRVEYLPPHSAEPKAVKFLQRQLIFPGKTGGFFVLEYYSPAAAARAFLPLFEAAAASLKTNI